MLRVVVEGVAGEFQGFGDAVVVLLPGRVVALGDEVGALRRAVEELAERKFLRSACWVGEGGLQATLAEACAGGGVRVRVAHGEGDGVLAGDAVLESGAVPESGAVLAGGLTPEGGLPAAVVSCRFMAYASLVRVAERSGPVMAVALGRTVRA